MKRKVKQNIYGNWVGYVGKSREVEFGDHAYSEGVAKVWEESNLTYQDSFDKYYNNMDKFKINP